MADMNKIIDTITKVLENAPSYVSAGIGLVEIAKQLYDTIGKPAEEITDAELDALAIASDAAHAEVQKPIPDDPAPQ